MFWNVCLEPKAGELCGLSKVPSTCLQTFLFYCILLFCGQNATMKVGLCFLSGETRFPLKKLKTFLCKGLDQKSHLSIIHNINSVLVWIKTTVNNYFIPESVFVFLYQGLKLCHALFFNLAILDERDRELAQYDNLTTKTLVVNQNS